MFSPFTCLWGVNFKEIGLDKSSAISINTNKISSQLSSFLSLTRLPPRYFSVSSTSPLFLDKSYYIFVDDFTGLIVELILTGNDIKNGVTLYDKYPQYKVQIDKLLGKYDLEKVTPSPKGENISSSVQGDNDYNKGSDCKTYEVEILHKITGYSIDYFPGVSKDSVFCILDFYCDN